LEIEVKLTEDELVSAFRCLSVEQMEYLDEKVKKSFPLSNF
jgi:hypothetical protein